MRKCQDVVELAQLKVRAGNLRDDRREHGILGRFGREQPIARRTRRRRKLSKKIDLIVNVDPRLRSELVLGRAGRLVSRRDVVGRLQDAVDEDRLIRADDTEIRFTLENRGVGEFDVEVSRQGLFDERLQHGIVVQLAPRQSRYRAA